MARLGDWRAIRQAGNPQITQLRWNGGFNGRPKAWYTDVADHAIEGERVFLRQEIYGQGVEIEAYPITAFNRYSLRC